LSRIFEPKRDDVTKKWRKLHYEKFDDLYCSPYIFRAIISRRKRWAGYVECMGERRGVYRVLVGKLREKEHLGE